MKKKKSHISVLAIQLIFTTVVFMLLRLLRPVSILYTVSIYVLIPLLGAISAFYTVDKGINAYLAWLVPPICATISGLIASMGYLPEAGSVILCAFISLTGAAAGETAKRFKGNKKKR